MKGGDAKSYKSTYKGGEYMNMRDLLLLHIDKENDRLNDYGNILISIRHKNASSDFQSNVMFETLAIEFENITEKLNNVNFVVINCINNKELLRTCVDYINEISFMVMNFMLNIESLN